MIKIVETTLKDLKILEFSKFFDDRGYFFESYNKNVFEKLGIKNEFVQDNISVSKSKVIRGMHGQMKPNQAKLVRCLYGEIYDVAIDIRKNSITYMHHFGLKLSKKNNRALFIPHGFLHGFSVLSEEDAIVTYKTTGIYNKNGEYGVNPTSCKINWLVDSPILSARDLESLHLEDFIKSEIFTKIQNSL